MHNLLLWCIIYYMKELGDSPILGHHSRAVDAMLVLVLVFGLWILGMWLLTPSEETGVFSMQLIAQQDVKEAAYIYDAPYADIHQLQRYAELTPRQ